MQELIIKFYPFEFETTQREYSSQNRNEVMLMLYLHISNAQRYS